MLLSELLLLHQPQRQDLGGECTYKRLFSPRLDRIKETAQRGDALTVSAPAHLKKTLLAAHVSHSCRRSSSEAVVDFSWQSAERLGSHIRQWGAAAVVRTTSHRAAHCRINKAAYHCN